MKVQVFIPTFNRAVVLTRAVRSVLSQTCPNVEVVILDNHSTDDTVKAASILRDSDPRVKYIRHQSNLGMTGNFNAIRDFVDADYFSVLTDDDEYEPGFVKTALDCFALNASTEFVACNAPTRVRGEILGSQLDNWAEGYYKANTAVMKCLSGQYPLITNCLFRSSLKRDFVFSEKMGNVADGLLLTCLFAKYNSFVTKTITGYWNNDGMNASSLQKYDPVAHVDTTMNLVALYKQFCRVNSIPVSGAMKLELKKIISVLVAADKSGFRYILRKSALKDTYGLFAIACLLLFHKVKILDACIKIKSLLRRGRALALKVFVYN